MMEQNQDKEVLRSKELMEAADKGRADQKSKSEETSTARLRRRKITSIELIALEGMEFANYAQKIAKHEERREQGKEKCVTVLYVFIFMLNTRFVSIA